MHYSTAIVLIGVSLLGACAGLVGSFAVLRRRSLTGDALAHAALPGLCIAFLLVGEKSLPAMLAGALVSGLVGIALISGLTLWTRIKEDAAIGLVLSVAYGFGVVLLRIIQNQTTGGSKAGLNSFILGKTAGMIAEDVYLIAGVSLGCLLLIVMLHKEFKVVAFDPAFAQVQGWPAYWLDLLLMAMIAVTVVIGLPAVGVVLMSALLIIPAATARFWTRRFGMTLILSAMFGTTIGVVGTAVTANFPFPAGPSIVLVGGILFLVSILFAPQQGIIARVLDERRFRRQQSDESFLRACYEVLETQPAAKTVPLTELSSRYPSRTRSFAASQNRLILQGLLMPRGESEIVLTAAGTARAAELVRAKRLTELALERHLGTSEGLVAIEPDRIDEQLPAPLIAELESQLREQGRLPAAGGTSE